MKVSLRSFLKRHWLTIIAILVGYALSNHFYKKSIVKPEPVFLIDPVRTKIIESKHILETPLRLVRLNGGEIKGNVTSVRFYFWNNGRKSIKKSNILEPLVITLDDPNGEILDYKILKCSREVVKPVVDRNSVDPNKNLSLSFAILEKEDGLTGQVIYKGNPEATLEIDGVVEGVRRILTSAVFQKRWYKVVIKDIAILFSIVGFSVILVFILEKLLISKLTKPKQTKPKPTKMSEMSWTGWVLLTLFGILLIVGIIVGSKRHIKKAQEKAVTSAIQEVPKDIIP